MTAQTMKRWTYFGIAAVVLLYAWDAWQRRWIADDGLIVVRTAREILAGNGPNLSGFERAEADTSVLWTWLVAGAAWISRADVAHVAVALGGLLSVVGFGVAIDATRRFLVQRGTQGVLVPAGALLVVGVYPFWDYATSGLETGLCFAWIATIWWLLVALRPGRELAYSIVVGLGPLVRPDFALTSAIFLAAGWWIVRPSWRRTVLLAGTAAALPFAYEVFRAGYYGTLVPLPALAKSASNAAWDRGLRYLYDFERPYKLWIPALVIAALATNVLVRRIPRRGEWVVLLAPVVSGALSALFVVRVGGDFMHARMFLVPVLLAVLPLFVLPIRPATIPVLLGLGLWALVIGIRLDDLKPHATMHPIEDERAGYVRRTRQRHPVDAAPFIKAEGKPSQRAAEALAHGERMMLSQDGLEARLAPDVPAALVYMGGRLGTAGAVAPVDDIVGDTLGLGNPLGARITPTNPGYPGHEKSLPLSWLIADFADPAIKDDIAGTPPMYVQAARHAMHCGALADLLASVREPMSPHRFWDNLVHAVRRTRLVVPADPFDAEAHFCGPSATRIVPIVSSSYELEGFSRWHLTDGERTTRPANAGYSSLVPNKLDHDEWIELRLPTVRWVSGITLYPIDDGKGFPGAVTIEARQGGWFGELAHRTDVPAGPAPLLINWQPVLTDRIRITGSHLRQVQDFYVMQLSEIELR